MGDSRKALTDDYSEYYSLCHRHNLIALGHDENFYDHWETLKKGIHDNGGTFPTPLVKTEDMGHQQTFKAILSELEYVKQAEDRGDTHVTADFPLSSALEAIRYNLDKANRSWYGERDPYPETMKLLRKIGALCFQAGFRYGMPARVVQEPEPEKTGIPLPSVPYTREWPTAAALVYDYIDPSLKAMIGCKIWNLVTDLPDGTLHPLRRTGNTTRQVNQAIEWLMEGNAVHVIDHTRNVAANSIILGIIIRRIREEFRGHTNKLSVNYSASIIAPTSSLASTKGFISMAHYPRRVASNV